MSNSRNILLSITNNSEYSRSLISTQAHELTDRDREREREREGGTRCKQLVNLYFFKFI